MNEDLSSKAKQVIHEEDKELRELVERIERSYADYCRALSRFESDEEQIGIKAMRQVLQDFGAELEKYPDQLAMYQRDLEQLEKGEE